MTQLIAVFIRHGDYHQLADTPSAHQPFPLTEQGRQQAKQAVDQLLEMANKNQWHIHPQIHSSNLLRGWQTADIIAQGLDQVGGNVFQVQGFDALAERSMGSAANLTLQQIEEILQVDPRFELPPAHWKSDSHYRLPLQGAETLLQAGQRIAEHVRQQMESLQSDERPNIMQLFVGHGAAFRHAAYHLGVLSFEQIARLSMYHATPVAMQVMPGQHWRHVAGDWKVRAPNDREID